MRAGWKKLAEENGLKISVSGIPALSTYSFQCDKPLAYKTLITQEMLKKGFLASTAFYASTAHNETDMSVYFEALNEIYQVIAKCEKGELDVMNLLEGPICHSGFARLN